MRAFRFLHAADLHLDSPFKGMTALPSAVRDKVLDSTFQALRNMVRIAVREDVDFVVVGGDVYDLSDRSLRAQIRFREAAEQLAERGIAMYVVHGNHDPQDGRRAELSWPDMVHFFRSDHVEARPALTKKGSLAAYVNGISYATAAVTDNLAARFRRSPESVYHIGLLHANVEGDPNHDNYAPCRRSDLLASGMDYWALGHIHTRHIVHESPYIVYPGNIQGRSVRETGPRGCFVVDVSETGTTSLAFHATDSLRWFQRDVSLDGVQTEQALLTTLEASMERIGTEADGRSAMVRFTLRGRTPIHRKLQHGTLIEECVAELRERHLSRLASGMDSPFVWVESCRVNTGIETDLQQLMEQRDFLGDLLRLVDRFREDGQEQQALFQEALSPLVSHWRAGKYAAPLTAQERDELLQAAEALAVETLMDDGGWER